MQEVFESGDDSIFASGFFILFIILSHSIGYTSQNKTLFSVFHQKFELRCTGLGDCKRLTEYHTISPNYSVKLFCIYDFFLHADYNETPPDCCRSLITLVAVCNVNIQTRCWFERDINIYDLVTFSEVAMWHLTFVLCGR